MESNSRKRWWLTSPVHQGDHGGAVKTIAQGMPFVSGGPCKCACVFLLLHAKLRVHRASGIPCALYFLKAREILCKTRAQSVARSRSLARHCERERSTPESLPGTTLDCFVASAPRNDGAGCLKIESSPLSRD